MARGLILPFLVLEYLLEEVLQVEDVDVEYEGLAELSGCNCNMIVTYDEDDDDDEKEELKFYSETSDPSCYPDGGAPGDACALNLSAPKNITDISVTELVSHPEMSALNADAP